jgi:predicted DNA-binding transcriptional regulator YafY
MVRMNQMARIIREKKAVPFGELCMMMNLAPATMYQYARLMKNVFLDIKFENGVFSSTADERVERLTGQKELRS